MGHCGSRRGAIEPAQVSEASLNASGSAARASKPAVPKMARPALSYGSDYCFSSTVISNGRW